MNRMITDGNLRVKDKDTMVVMKRRDGLCISVKTSDAIRTALAAQDIDYFYRLVDEVLAYNAQRPHLAKKKALEVARIKEAAAKGIPIERVTITPDPGEPGHGDPKAVKTYFQVMPWHRRLHCWLSRPVSSFLPRWMKKKEKKDEGK